MSGDDCLAAISRQSPGGPDGIGHGYAGVIAGGFQAILDVFDISLFAVPEVGAAGAIEKEAVGEVDGGGGREADGPCGEAFQQFFFEARDVVDDFEAGDDGAGVGYGGAGVDALCPGEGVCGGDELTAVFGRCQDEGRVFQGRPAAEEPVRL